VIGETIAGRYRIERLLGRGGMSSVWLAHDDALERNVTIKLLHAARLASAEAVERFEREARMLASLTHPGIVMVLDRGQSGDRHYIVFEYVEGRDLRERIDEGPMPASEALAICAQVAEALSHAHAHGLVHRDVKPHNVLLTADGLAKLTDFGIALALTDPGLTQTGRVLGTGDYIAPEQALGKPVDARTDVYALGAVLFHCLCGRPPYLGTSPVDVAGKHVHAPLPSACALRPELPARVDELLARAMAKTPADRYQTSTQLATELEAVLEDEAARSDTADVPVVAQALRAQEATDANARAADGARARRSYAAWAALLAVLLAGGALWATSLVDITGESHDRQASGATDEPTTAPTTITTAPETTATPAPLPITAATSYDPAPGDGRENPDTTGLVLDGDAATTWTTETYRGSSDANDKGGVGLVLDPGGAVEASELVLQTPTPGWAARVFAVDSGEIPATLAEWAPASDPFTAVSSSVKVPLEAGERRLLLVWITQLAGEQGDWRVEIAEAQLVGTAAQKR